jgi:hypothetical protein
VNAKLYLFLAAAALLVATLPVVATSVGDEPAPDRAQVQESCPSQARIDLLGADVVPMTPAVGPNEPSELPGTLPPPEDVDFCDWDYRWVDGGCCSNYKHKVKQQHRWCCEIKGCGGWSDTGSYYCENPAC